MYVIFNYSYKMCLIVGTVQKCTVSMILLLLF